MPIDENLVEILICILISLTCPFICCFIIFIHHSQFNLNDYVRNFNVFVHVDNSVSCTWWNFIWFYEYFKKWIKIFFCQNISSYHWFLESTFCVNELQSKHPKELISVDLKDIYWTIDCYWQKNKLDPVLRSLCVNE